MGALKTGCQSLPKYVVNYWTALLVSALMTIPTSIWARHHWQSQYGKRPTWETTDIDTGLIHDGLLQAPHLVDTLRWWVGTWVGEVPFYRPLASYLFWIEWKLFGSEEWRYGPPTLAAHVLATVLAAAVAYRLAERWQIRYPAIAAVGAAAIFTGLTRAYRHGVIAGVAGLWKNQPDSFAAICCFLAILAYLRAQRSARLWAGVAAAWYLAACGFKEIAVPLPMIFAALEIAGPRPVDWWRSAARVALPAACGLLFLVIRQWALGGVGYRYGSNSSWIVRSLLELTGPFSPWIHSGYWPGCVNTLFALGVIALCWGTRSWWGRWKQGAASVTLAAALLIVLGTVVFGTWFQWLQEPERWLAQTWDLRIGVALLMVADSTYASCVQGILFVAAVTLALWKRSRAVIWFAPWWTLVFLAPLTLSPGPSHRLYLPQFGYILFDAMGFCALLAMVCKAGQTWWQVSRHGETSGKYAASAIQ